MHLKNNLSAGKPLTANSNVLVMVHGRGGSAEDILSLSSYLHIDDFSLVAPQATNHTWYPYSFLAPPVQNEPWLSSALQLLKELADDLQAQGISSEKIYFLGFSQGACLTLEFVTRHAKRYGGVMAFTGGLIGDRLYTDHYAGDFDGTPVFIGTSDPDPHVPVSRVQETEAVLKKMNAAVMVKIYPGMGHTISQEELVQANQILRLAERSD